MISESEIIELIKKAEEGPTLDYKENLPLATDGDKAEFVKDVIALANSGETAHLIVGVEDSTWKPVGIKTSHKAEQLNEILKDKCDPRISVEYLEKNILGYKIGVIEIAGKNPPYIVSVPAKFGGPVSGESKKPFYIHRGTVFIRNYNINEGACRVDLDQMYSSADLQLTHEIKERKVKDDSIEVNVGFILTNVGRMAATFVRVSIQFNNIMRVVKRDAGWQDIGHLRNNVPTIQLDENVVHLDEIFHLDGATLQVSKDIKQVEALVSLYAANMRRKKDVYVITL